MPAYLEHLHLQGGKRARVLYYDVKCADCRRLVRVRFQGGAHAPDWLCSRCRIFRDVEAVKRVSDKFTITDPRRRIRDGLGGKTYIARGIPSVLADQVRQATAWERRRERCGQTDA